MTRQEALTRVLRDVASDIADYGRLRDALEHQFQAALRHDSARLTDITQEITDLVDLLEQRRLMRVQLTQALTKEAQPRSIDGVLAQLHGAQREALATDWATLEELVRGCKALNSRNCDLIVTQNTIMQHVLHGEENCYVGP